VHVSLGFGERTDLLFISTEKRKSKNHTDMDVSLLDVFGLEFLW
jgi:hypothetical protein